MRTTSTSLDPAVWGWMLSVGTALHGGVRSGRQATNVHGSGRPLPWVMPIRP